MIIKLDSLLIKYFHSYVLSIYLYVSLLCFITFKATSAHVFERKRISERRRLPLMNVLGDFWFAFHSGPQPVQFRVLNPHVGARYSLGELQGGVDVDIRPG